MRQALQSVRSQTRKERMERIRRKVQIRKEKLYGIHFQPSEDSTQTEHKQTSHREDKFYQQKLKNRQAAQKSREQKKLYTAELQKELQRLKHVISRCQACRNQLETLSSQTDNTHEETIERSLNEVQYLEDEIQEPESHFYRVRSNSEDSSIGIYLFLFMIIIGLFCMGARLDSSGSAGPARRDLMQTYNLPQEEIFSTQNSQELIQSALQPVHSFHTNRNPTYSTHHQVDIDPAKYQNGLLSMDQVRSPTSISDEKVFDKIITAFENYKMVQYDEKNLRSKVGLIDANKSLMFCNRPKIYKSVQDQKGIITTFLDIFVQGVEIVNILSPSNGNSLTPGTLQLDGLYKITASVEEIEEIPNPNFIY